MGHRIVEKWPCILVFVLVYCSINTGSQHGALVADAAESVSLEFDKDGFTSQLLLLGKTLLSPLIWTKNAAKLPKYKEPTRKESFVHDGEKEERMNKRTKRSYSDYKHKHKSIDQIDKFELSSSISAEFILVVVLGVPVNRTTLLWLRIAFAKQLDLPLDNVVVLKTSEHLETYFPKYILKIVSYKREEEDVHSSGASTGSSDLSFSEYTYNAVELFFFKLDRPENSFLLIPAKDVMNATLLEDIQHRVPFLNVTKIHPQHQFIISHYKSQFWMESYFPYLAAAGSVALVLLVAVVIYCCCKRRQKLSITDKEPAKKSQQIFYPTVKPNMKDPMMIQPEGSPVFVTKGCVAPVQTQSTRVKAKGLLERRGSNASLTLDLNASPEMARWDGTPPKESSCLEYMLSAGNRLSRRDLRNSIKNNRALYEEFWEIPMNLPEKVHIAGSGMKNRYKTIIPNEFTRVILPDNEWDPLSSYINANYIRGYEGEIRAYIATQGPMSHTIVDFWRMVWVEKSPIIVMITKLKEKNKPKCENYLPEDYKSCTFGDIDVKVDRVVVKGGYSLRHLLLKCNGEMQHVLHYWYTAWPDHKPPESPTMLLDLVKEVELHRYRGDGHRKRGPVIVHCSAGIGRTGCFIAISIGMKQLREEHSVDILGTVCSLRLDRGGTIQTHEQYEFIHQALCEYEKELAEPVTNYNDD